MRVEFVTVKYMHCHISLYSEATSENTSNKKITNVPLYFLLKQKFVWDNIKADLKFIYFLRNNISLFVGF